MAAGNGSAVTGRLSAAARSLRDGGIRSTAWRGGKWLAGRFNAFQGAPLESVYADDLVAVDWSMPVAFNAREVRPARHRDTGSRGSSRRRDAPAAGTRTRSGS